jgi:predicted AAA+ superfamily ATPase
MRGHFVADRQMLFIAGPRQVGKTTAARAFGPEAAYFNWDNEDHRGVILAGPAALTEAIGLAADKKIIFDEIHKYPNWRDFLKGWFDTYAADGWQVVVTGSARLDTLRKGADSLMGRYFLRRMHPLSIREIAAPGTVDEPPAKPLPVPDADYEALLRHGGFPEPFLRRDTRFTRRWRGQRQDLVFREDLRDTSRVYEVGQVVTLATLLRHQVGRVCNYSSLGRKLRASDDSIRRWVSLLEALYYCFLIRPWSANVPRSLLKEPKVYLWDWASCPDPGFRNENFVASHLLKAVHAWQDEGIGDFGLHHLRTKDKREVDFVVSRDEQPWLLVETKTSRGALSPHLRYFHERLGTRHAYQVVIEDEYIDVDCFERGGPTQVPARTFLSQLP